MILAIMKIRFLIHSQKAIQRIYFKNTNSFPGTPHLVATHHYPNYKKFKFCDKKQIADYMRLITKYLFNFAGKTFNIYIFIIFLYNI